MQDVFLYPAFDFDRCMMPSHPTCRVSHTQSRVGNRQKSVGPSQLEKLEMVWAKDHARLVSLLLVPWSCPVPLCWPAASAAAVGRWRREIKSSCKKGRFPAARLWSMRDVPSPPLSGTRCQKTAVWEQKPRWQAGARSPPVSWLWCECS